MQVSHGLCNRSQLYTAQLYTYIKSNCRVGKYFIVLRFYPAEGEVVGGGKVGEGVESKGLVAKTMEKF